jgi:hypothetical protein
MDLGLSFTVDMDLTAVGARLLAAFPPAIHAGLEHVAEVSAAETPRDTEALVKSQRGTPEAEITDTGAISYGTGYAIYVHEILKNHHPVGRAKFLELPMKEEGGQAKKIAAHRIGEAI